MATCLRLQELQKVRMFCIVSQSRCDRAMDSALARCLGYDPEATERDRKAVFALARSVRIAVEKEKDLPSIPGGDQRIEALTDFLPLVPLSAQARAIWDAKRLTVEAEMRRLGKTLPVYEWVKENARGVGELGLARIVGEAPLIGQYATHERLWKRMGLAVIAGERQQRKSSAEEALLHGYAPRRRAEGWSVSDVMIYAQWRGPGGDPDGVGSPVGPYGEVYRVRKARTAPRIAETETLPKNDRQKWTKARCNNDARRIMFKAFLQDLWRVWRGKEAIYPARWEAICEEQQAA